MKTLVVYYSKTGNTRRIAEKIANILKADSDEITDRKKRTGIIGFMGGGRDAMKGNLTEISCKKNPENYDLIIAGTPIWASTLTPAVRTYLHSNRDKINKIAFFCTGGGQVGKTFRDMEKLSKRPLAALSINDKSIDSSDDKIKSFCERLK